jgi:hypothetical protein
MMSYQPTGVRLQARITRLETTIAAVIAQARQPNGTYDFETIHFGQRCPSWANGYEKLRWYERELVRVRQVYTQVCTGVPLRHSRNRPRGQGQPQEVTPSDGT